MWNRYYGNEPMDLKLLALRFGKKCWIFLVTSVLGVLLAGGPYFLVHVVYGPARQYEAVTDIYVDYAKLSTGAEYTYFNQNTWTQLMQDDVFTDKIMAAMGNSPEIDKAALKKDLNATMLSDTRIVTTTVRTTDPGLTMRVNKAVIKAFGEFAGEQKEIAGIRILQQPEKAQLVKADVRTFRACMLGLITFDAVAFFYMLLYMVLDDSVYLPASFEKRYRIPMVGTIHSQELKLMVRQFFTKPPLLITADKNIELGDVKSALLLHGVEAGVCIDMSGEFVETIREQIQASGELLLVIKAGAHNGRMIEKTMEICAKCGCPVKAALLWEADEKLIHMYYLPQHVFGKVFGSGRK